MGAKGRREPSQDKPGKKIGGVDGIKMKEGENEETKMQSTKVESKNAK